MTKKRIKDFDSSGKCPICQQWFKSDACPHTYVQAEERIQKTRLEHLIETIVEKVLRKYGLIE